MSSCSSTSQAIAVEVRAQAEATEEQCSLACSSWLVQPAFSYSTQDYQPRDGATHGELGLPVKTPIKKTQHRLCSFCLILFF